MALDTVIRDILEKAKTEADKIIAEAQRERDSISKECEESIAKKKRAQEKQLEELTRRLAQQEISSAELEAKKIVLNAKKEMLDRAFSEALREIYGMDRESRARVYNKIVEGAKTIIPRPRIVCPKGDASLVQKDATVLAVVEDDMEPGLIIESEDGLMRLDFRFRTMLEDIWEREMKKISTILFG
ncbi:MAG: V-type ATP synthase subunit E family protein [Methanomassiliicoccales archaeon]|jgi:V/A-type H+-transporting ATPase subunit E|nr:V-type ATP synthase subunit E family protein [Methanomassiliicoccales archaeon]